MKRIIAILSVIGVMAGCKSHRETGNITYTRATPPMFVQDMMVEDYSTARTNAEGASGPGLGAAAGANLYRREALRAISDTNYRFRQQNVTPGNQQESEGVIENQTDTSNYDQVPW
jgi:hypothetical protein